MATFWPLKANFLQKRSHVGFVCFPWGKPSFTASKGGRCGLQGALFFDIFVSRFCDRFCWLIFLWFCSLLGPFLAPVWPSEGSLGQLLAPKRPSGEVLGPILGATRALGGVPGGFGTPNITNNYPNCQIDPPKPKIDLQNVENRSQKDPKTNPK